MNLRFPKGFPLKAVILFTIGAVFSIFARQSKSVPALIILVDMLFSAGMVFLILGLIHMVGNANMFASTTYSFKTIKELFRGQMQKAEDMKEDYLEYRSTRKTYDDVPHLMISALILMALSVAINGIFG